MKILDILSMIHRICKRYSGVIVKIFSESLFIVLVVFIFYFISCSSSRLTPEEIYLRGAEDISRDFDEQFNRVFCTYGDSLHLYGFRVWKHSNMTERLSR